jgi:ABC-type sulfate transport system substrate-binding protein
MFDNGKIKITALDGIPLIEVYHNGELQLKDVEWINYVVLHELTPAPKTPIDIIVDRKGNYSLSADAFVQMQYLMKEASRVAYVVYSPTQEKMVQMASALYLSGKQVANFYSLNDAVSWLDCKPS